MLNYVKKRLNKYDLNGLRKSDNGYENIGYITIDGKECMVYGSRKAFSENLPSTSAIVSKHLNTWLVLSDMSIVKDEAVTGIRAVYTYRGRVPYSLSYENYGLQVFFPLSAENSSSFNEPTPIPAPIEVVAPDTETRPIRVLSLDGGEPVVLVRHK